MTFTGLTLADATKQVAESLHFDSDNDRAFFLRVYNTDQSIYEKRLRAIGFSGLNTVLDAGCGFGQWTLTLAKMNRRVLAQDISGFRLDVLGQVAAKVGVAKIERLPPSSLDVLPVAENSVDGLFCYGAIFFVDYRKALREFHRVLKPNGRLYFTANGYGWYLHNLIKNHNPAKDFSPRRMAIETFINTARLGLGTSVPGKQVVMPVGQVISTLKKLGFVDIVSGGDGTINPTRVEGVRQFFKGEYYGLSGVYEILCKKGE